MTGRNAGRRVLGWATLILSLLAGHPLLESVVGAQSGVVEPKGVPEARFSSRVMGGAFQGDFHLRRLRTPAGRYSSTVGITTPAGVEGVVAVEWDAAADELLVVFRECSTGWYAGFGRSSGVRIGFEDFGWEGITKLAVERTIRMTELRSVLVDALVIAGTGEGVRRWAFSPESYSDHRRNALGALRDAFVPTPEREALDADVIELLSFLYSARETLPSNPVADVGEILEELLFPVLEPDLRSQNRLEEYSIRWQREKIPSPPQDSGIGSRGCSVPALEGWLRSLRSR